MSMKCRTFRGLCVCVRMLNTPVSPAKTNRESVWGRLIWTQGTTNYMVVHIGAA